jgi:hypothetical protein
VPEAFLRLVTPLLYSTALRLQSPVQGRNACPDNLQDSEEIFGIALMRCPGLRLASSEPDSSANMLTNWKIDPAYYLYSGCICVQPVSFCTLSTGSWF